MNPPAFTEMSGGGNGGPVVAPAADGTREGGEKDSEGSSDCESSCYTLFLFPSGFHV